VRRVENAPRGLIFECRALAGGDDERDFGVSACHFEHFDQFWVQTVDLGFGKVLCHENHPLFAPESRDLAKYPLADLPREQNLVMDPAGDAQSAPSWPKIARKAPGNRPEHHSVLVHDLKLVNSGFAGRAAQHFAPAEGASVQWVDMLHPSVAAKGAAVQLLE